MRLRAEIEEVRSWACESMDTGSKYPGMTYEEGVEAALAWMTGDTEERPDDD